MDTLRRADARFLLPPGPHRVLLLADTAWESGLRAAGWEVSTDPAQPCDVAIVDRPRRRLALASTAFAVLVEGRAKMPGFAARAWTSVLRRDGPVAVAPAGDASALRFAVRAWEPSDPRAAALRRALLTLPTDRPLPRTTVLHRGQTDGADVLTSVAQRLGAPARCRPVLLLGGGSDRRRVTALLLPSGSSAPVFVLKAERFPSGEDRGSREQAATEQVRSLRLPGVHVPRVLAVTRQGPDGGTASLEEAAAGQPLRTVRGRTGRAALDVIATWLVELAAATSQSSLSTHERQEIQGTLAMRWAPGAFTDVLEAVAQVPAVLTHGDLVDGGNVLVEGARVAVVDWETSRRGLPLQDLLPAFGHALAVARVGPVPSDVAAEILRCATGGSPDSPALVAAVHAMARRLQLPPDAVGPLALFAWLWHGAQPAVHRVELAKAGLPSRTWDSIPERVAAGWLNHPGLGRGWPALPR